jgi:hypothetical protein
MVAHLTTPDNPRQAIHYNEQKVAARKAEFIHAGNFLKEADELSLAEKEGRFDALVALNRRVERYSLHVSINFAEEERLSNDLLIIIAGEYMERIGFGDQPFLVYKHLDAGHPHIHIVSTNIQPDGKPINTRFIARDRSEPARKALEQKFGLINAQRSKRPSIDQKNNSAEKVQYGNRPTVRAMTDTLHDVLNEYRYRSLPELNAILRLYNLKANGGKPESKLHANRGLVYHVLDEQGKPVGIPMRASAISFNPGLKFLEEKFSRYQAIDPLYAYRVRFGLDNALGRNPKSWEEFNKFLIPERIAASPLHDAEGRILDIGIVDLRGRVVIPAGELGSPYSQQAILDKIELSAKLPNELTQEAAEKKKNKSLHL